MTTNIQQFIPIVSISPEEARNPAGCISTANCIDLHISYNEGSRHWATGAVRPRGYYLHATPIERNEQSGVTTMILGCGVMDCLLEVTRRSDKQLEIATKIAESKAFALLEWCRAEYGILYQVPASFFPDAKKREVPKNLKKSEQPKTADPESVKPIRTMKLLTAEVIRKLEKHPLGSQEGMSDNAEVLVKFFGGACTFLVTEGEKQEDGNWVFFGKMNHGWGWEWGYVTLSEIENTKVPPFGLGLERDMYLASGATVGELTA